MNLLDKQQILTAEAWRIEYASKPLPNRTPLTVIRRPRAAWAYGQAIEQTAVLAERATATVDADDFTFVFVRAGEVTPYEVQKQVESWMAGRPGESGGPIEIQFRGERLIWRQRRAVCFGAPHSRDEVLAAVCHFSFCERELSRIEEKVEATWPTLQNDTYLTDKLSGRDLKNRAHVGAMTRTATDIRVDYVRIQTALESPATELAGLSRRLFAELAVQANVVDRLRLLEDAVEVMGEFYRFVQEQLTDLRSYRGEVRGNALILIVLIIELLITIYGVFSTEILNFFHYVSPS